MDPTRCSTQVFSFDDEQVVQRIRSRDLFCVMKKRDNSRFMLTAGTRERNASGPVAAHSYSVIEVKV